MVEGVIYKYTSPSGKVYIGQTFREAARKREHKSTAFNDKSRGVTSPFHNAIKKYGYDSFTYEVPYKIDSDDIEEATAILNEKEMYYIETLNSRVPNGYNVAIGGESKRGYIMPEERKRKISETNKGHTINEEQRARLKKALIGHKVSEETKEKIRQAHIGKKLSEETKRKLSTIGKGRPRSEEWKRNISKRLKGRPCTWADKVKQTKAKIVKAVLQYTLDGALVKEYTSTESASLETGIKMSTLYKCLSGKNKSSGEFIWKYKEKKFDYNEHL